MPRRDGGVVAVALACSVSALLALLVGGILFYVYHKDILNPPALEVTIGKDTALIQGLSTTLSKLQSSVDANKTALAAAQAAINSNDATLHTQNASLTKMQAQQTHLEAQIASVQALATNHQAAAHAKQKALGVALANAQAVGTSNQKALAAVQALATSNQTAIQATQAKQQTLEASMASVQALASGNQKALQGSQKAMVAYLAENPVALSVKSLTVAGNGTTTKGGVLNATASGVQWSPLTGTSQTDFAVQVDGKVRLHSTDPLSSSSQYADLYVAKANNGHYVNVQGSTSSAKNNTWTLNVEGDLGVSGATQMDGFVSTLGGVHVGGKLVVKDTTIGPS